MIPTVGTDVEFIREVDRYPHVLVQVGETGRVDIADTEMITVRLDRYVPALDEWDNCVIFTRAMDTYDEFAEACRAFTPPIQEEVR